MSGSPRMFKSVWNLKQYVDQLVALPTDAVESPPLVPSVTRDYGYDRCRSPAERKLLNDLHKQLFAKRDMDPLALHEACIADRLLNFAKCFVKLGSRSATVKYARHRRIRTRLQGTVI